jgi:hypothetical protein
MNTTRDFGNHLCPPASARGEVSGVFRIQPMAAASAPAASGGEQRTGTAQPSTPPIRMRRILSVVLRWIR